MTQLRSYKDLSPVAGLATWEFKDGYQNLATSKLLSLKEEGMDIHYELAVVRIEGQFTVAVPWAVRSVCPACYGSGQVVTQSGQGDIYRATACHRCGERGYLETISPITVLVTPRMAEEGQIWLKGAGLYDPRSTSRGDLLLKLKFVDSLPQSH
ncbi:MAG: hypothetical protein LBR11_02760 [Deltaproteobacteria bacterium]|jgi:hypothetical protein|nr:hypothetical protein [Deltaproteobacteria bacterium]